MGKRLTTKTKLDVVLTQNDTESMRADQWDALR